MRPFWFGEASDYLTGALSMGSLSLSWYAVKAVSLPVVLFRRYAVGASRMPRATLEDWVQVRREWVLLDRLCQRHDEGVVSYKWGLWVC